MRMRSRSVAASPPSLAVTVGGTTGASRSLLNLPGELKVHYSEVVNVAEKLTRLFSRSHSYNVHKHHKTLEQASKKPSHSWVTVHNLKQLDGGILDPDDRLNDVADDREQIIALYEEQPSQHQGGDGTSASSDSENPSPDIFQDVEHKFSPFTRNDIEITGEELSGAPPPLHVRRGSEPALNRLSPIPPVSIPPDPTKRWSAAPIIEDQNPALSSSTPMKTIQDGHSSYEDDSVFVVDPGERGEGSGEEKTPSSSTSSHHSSAATAFSRFNRDTNRCSVQVLSDNPIMARWADAADNALASSEGRRREPLGGSASSPLHFRDSSHEDSNTILVVLSNDRGPLGIHVIPSTDGRGRDQGLLVEGVEPAGRIARDGRIQVHDRIVEINGRSLSNITFQKAQEIFKDAMQTPELRLQVVKSSGSNHQRQGSCTELVEGEERTVGGAKVASVTATRKVGGASLSSRTQAVILQSNTRKLGRRVIVHLIKGPHGLGFSITTRDNPAGGEAPIYIKNILPKGAAIEDGTLRIGDRLLEVNGVAVTGNSQSEVAGLLRQIPIGGTATLIVSRQDQRGSEGASIDSMADEKPSSPLLPRQLPSEKSPEDSLQFPWKHKEILVFEIPVHDSERAGLGVSVKGKTSSGPNGAVDLGIFVKNVIHGGAASRDGRLLQNDQLVNINGLSLLGKPNSEAMKTLRTAMHQEGPTPGMISLTVARRTDLSRERSSPSSANRSGRESANSLLTNSSGTETLGGTKSAPTTPTPDHSGITDASDATTVFHVNNKADERLPQEREFINDTFDVRNPVIQRLTNNNGALRNESYYKATHETWNTSQLQQLVMRVDRESLAPAVGGSSTLGSPTVNLPSRDTLIIHDDSGTHLSGHMSGHDGPGASAGSLSDHPSQSDDAYTSQTSLEENVAGFSRDQFGRQSMSEKRHATLDAKNTDTYQRNKKAREEREKQKQMMLAQEKLAATQGLGAAGMAGGPVEEVKPGLREVGIDVPPTEPPSGAPHPSPLAPPAGRPVPNTSCWGRPAKAKDENKPPKNKNKSVQGTKPSAKQQFMQGLRGPGLRRGSEPVGATLRRGQSGGHPRGPFSPVSRSLERHYGKGNQRTTFGQDLSNMISNWDALRSRLDFGPGLGMKKSSSLESLQTMVQEMTMEEEGHRMGSGRVPRGRGCNESFRAAVDRSYDVPLNGLRSKMETLAEEESESSGSGFGRGNSRQSSVNSAVDDKNKKMGKKKAGLLKGLGSMFRFGKHRKSVDNTNSGPGRGDREGERESRGEMDRAEVERLAAARRLQQEEHDHMQEQYRRLIENTARTSQQQQQQVRGEDGEPSRSERMHQLRAEHQRRHAQRNRTYPTDDMEEHYESAIRQMLEERGHLEADKANNNTLNPTDTKPQVMSDKSVVHRSNKSSQPSSSPVGSPSCNSSTNNKTKGTGNTNRHSFHGIISKPSGKSVAAATHRNSLYGACFRSDSDSPRHQRSNSASTPAVPEVDDISAFMASNKYIHNNDIYSVPCKTGRNPGKPKASDVHDAPAGDQEARVNNLSNLIIQKSVSSKPPLPPRNRPINNNYKPPFPHHAPKPNLGPVPAPPVSHYSTPPTNQRVHPQLSASNNSASQFSHLNKINPDFTFSFTKTLSDFRPASSYLPNNTNSSNAWDIANRNFINQNINGHNLTFMENRGGGHGSSNVCTEGKHQPSSGGISGGAVWDSSGVTSGTNIPGTQKHGNCISKIAAPLSSNNSSSSNSSSGSNNSNGSAVRTNSLPRMGVKGKEAAMSARGWPCPPPPPPPKGASVPLAALHSTAILDNSQFWRLEPVPNEPRPEVRHVRSHSYDLYGDSTGSRQGGEAAAMGGRPGSRIAYADPHTYSHYVNYEQIQQHLRKNKEQERLKKLASQQYQDFRDKQTSREAREYQSQRGPRDSARESHHRPVSNYYEYESVQAMISHAQDNSSTSLPRRHQPPPPPGAKNNEGIGSLHPGSSQPHHLTMYKPGPSTSVHTSQSGRGSGMPGVSHSQTGSYQNQGEKESLRVEGVYSSGFRPASHYTGPHHKPPPPPPHHSTKITVPGSKV